MRPVTSYIDPAARAVNARPTRDIFLDLTGKVDSHTYNLQGLYDYSTGEGCGETRNEGLSTRRCGLTSAMRVYRERCRRVREGEAEYRHSNGHIWDELHRIAYLYDEYRCTY